VSGNEPTGAARGIARSLAIYHRDAARIAAMDRLNAEFCPRGGLAFDIGAHVGDRVASFRRLGARVVAVEPQPAALRALRLMFGRDADVTLVQAAIAAKPGTVSLHINTRNPTVSTVSPDFIAAAREAPGWSAETWDAVIDVPALTLDDLVARHGTPDFVKIDVEGYEAEALAGLGTALPALSFEFTTIQRDNAQRALSRVSELGDYRFNVSLGERHLLEWHEWRGVEEMARYLDEVPQTENSGDIYARSV
jgi:FkbM family methyltransferase